MKPFAPHTVSVYRRPLQHQNRRSGPRKNRRKRVAGDTASDDHDVERFVSEGDHRLLRFRMDQTIIVAPNL
jgi:hypothetical protein